MNRSSQRILVLGTGAAEAMPKTSRQADGHIVSVEPAAQRFTFERTDNHQRLALTWNGRTKVYRGIAEDSARLLKPGQSARVFYRLPFFGPDYAGRVVLPAPGSQCEPAPKCRPAR